MLFFYEYFYLSLFLSTTRVNPLWKDLKRLKRSYPDHIRSVSETSIVWNDGTEMAVQDGKSNKSSEEKLTTPSLSDQMKGVYYLPGNLTRDPVDDPGRIRYLPFFKKMYGSTKDAVRSHLVTIYWLPKIFKRRFPLQVTTVNGIDKKLLSVSEELQELAVSHPEVVPFLNYPSGTFNWRTIAGTQRLSPHSFGMTIDINSRRSEYWQWDLKKQHRPINETEPLTYRNTVPLEIVTVFEKYGFLWGGKWYHYDTMHFEYRPELFP